MSYVTLEKFPYESAQSEATREASLRRQFRDVTQILMETNT